MKIQKQTGYTCLLYATAMVLDVPAEQLISEIGHNGDGVEWPELEPRSLCKRGFHIREMIEVCVTRGHGLTPIEIYPSHCPWRRVDLIKPLWSREESLRRFNDIVIGRKGIIICPPVGTIGLGHSIAFDGEDCYDPRGKIYKIDDAHIQEFWMLTDLIPKIKSD